MTGPRARAAALIRRLLADGPLPASEVEQAAAADGISISTVRRAARESGVVRTRSGGCTTWALPLDLAGMGLVGTAPVPAALADPPTEITEENRMTETETATHLLSVADGLTWPGGAVLAVGDVVAVPDRGTPAWNATCDRTGASFLDDLSPMAQMQRWGVVHLAATGAPDTEADTGTVSGPSPRRFVPGALPAVLAPGNHRLRPEGSVPLVVGLCGDGPVTVLADQAER